MYTNEIYIHIYVPMVFSFLLSSLSLSLSSLFPFFPLPSCIHTPNLETHFGFASIPSDESRLDQRLDAVVNRHVEVEDGGCKEKEKEEGNGLRGGGRRPTIRGKRLFDVASWTWLVASFWRPFRAEFHFISGPAFCETPSSRG